MQESLIQKLGREVDELNEVNSMFSPLKVATALHNINVTLIEDVVEAEEPVCEVCGGDGYIEVLGDGGSFECDVIGTKPCRECAYE